MQIKPGKVETIVKGIVGKLNKNNRLKRAAFGTTLVVTILTASGCGKKLNDALITQGFVQEQTLELENKITTAPVQTLEQAGLLYGFSYPDEISQCLDINCGYALQDIDGKIDGYDIDFTPLEIQQNGEEKLYIYDVYYIDGRGSVTQIKHGIPGGQVTMVTEPGEYFAVLKNKDTSKTYGVTKIVKTKELQNGAGFAYPDDISQCLDINYGYALQDIDGKIDGYDIDFTPLELQQSGAAEQYTYDIYYKDDYGNIERLHQGIPCGQVMMVTEPGEYFAVLKNKDTSKEYGVTKIVNTKNFGNMMGEVQNDETVAPSFHR